MGMVECMVHTKMMEIGSAPLRWKMPMKVVDKGDGQAEMGYGGCTQILMASPMARGRRWCSDCGDGT